MAIRTAPHQNGERQKTINNWNNREERAACGVVRRVWDALWSFVMTRARMAIMIGGLSALTLVAACGAHRGASGHADRRALLAAAPAALGWQDVPTPSPVRGGALNTVAVGDSRTAWAAGIEDPSGCPSICLPVTALYQWNGGGWARQSTPAQFVPVGLAAADARHAWAVGLGYPKPVAIFWNGVSWKRVSYPTSSLPVAISAGRDGSAWLVAGDVRHGSPAVLRWNGSGWSKVTPRLPAHSGLSSVGVRSGRDVWLAGEYGRDSKHMRALVMHWNGKSWKTLPVPSAPGGGAQWLALRPVSATNVWALRSPGSSALMHWNGKKWSVAAKLPHGQGALTLASDGGSGAWVIPYTTGSATRSYYLHWTGRAWQTYYGVARNGNAQLGDLALIPGTRNVLSVGAVQEMKPVRGKFPFTELFH
jgi:hypothetical protein